jgi:hypothetical protein
MVCIPPQLPTPQALFNNSLVVGSTIEIRNFHEDSAVSPKMFVRCANNVTIFLELFGLVRWMLKRNLSEDSDSEYEENPREKRACKRQKIARRGLEKNVPGKLSKFVDNVVLDVVFEVSGFLSSSIVRLSYIHWCV